MTGTFIDTIIICTMTGISVVLAGTWNDPNLEGVEITMAAFQKGLPFAPHDGRVAVGVIPTGGSQSCVDTFGQRLFDVEHLFQSSVVGGLRFLVYFRAFFSASGPKSHGSTGLSPS